ncbi:MAG TPA: ABC transporter ATP-binding protein [Anaerolineales bacterium]|nr:ABC transporter ATP-binding protein [Anaerolineales bacterium]
MTDQDWLIEAQEVVRVYGDGAEVRALDGVDLHVARGELVAVMGPSGSGKSTLLNVLGALDRPTSGRVLINGVDLAEIEDEDAFRAHTVGFVFQLHNLLPTLTALENVEIPMLGKLAGEARRVRGEELLGLVGLADRAGHLPSELSGGQRQRVAVARALANDPPLVLADEPTGNLDTGAGRELMTLLRQLNQTKGTTFVVVTHDHAVARQTNRVIVMQDGKIVREDIIGSPLEEDLKLWRHTGLGRRLLTGDEEAIRRMGLSDDELALLRGVLTRADR